ncbi:hypothetical protein C8F04DRAFT_1197985 [Mycena alexandri]|uniref:Uncharacterized protein n=1 Tax=Mycena alexandri TaxID=1745969 RepID=A0AAD6S1F9_9AGAR|nr:hypothetical protein C8F04DRAFT_1197985 [Mycena alexandri]
MAVIGLKTNTRVARVLKVTIESFAHVALVCFAFLQDSGPTYSGTSLLPEESAKAFCYVLTADQNNHGVTAVDDRPQEVVISEPRGLGYGPTERLDTLRTGAKGRTERNQRPGSDDEDRWAG